MNVFVHYPESEEDIAILRDKVAQVHSQAVIDYIERLNCSYSQKIDMINAIMASISKS